MTETQIRDALERATDDLSVRPDLLDRVRAGGHRRVVRRRAVLAGGLAVAAAGAAGPLMFRPERTTGPMGQDPAFLARVRSVWREAARYFEPVGRPQIRWAGSTPAGPAALVWQGSRAPGDVRGMQGFVYTENGKLRDSGGMHLVPDEAGEPMALLLGEKRNVLVVSDAGRRVYLSGRWDADAAGRIRRRFEPIGPVADGVRVIPIEDQTGTVRVGLRYGADGQVPLDNFGDVVPSSLDNQIPDRIVRSLPGDEAAWPDLDAWIARDQDGFTDTYGYHGFLSASSWFIRGVAPDGRRLAVETLDIDGRSRVFWTIGSPAARHYAGPLDGRFATRVPRQGTVLHVRLPDRQGIVVSALNAKLRYKTGAFLPVAGDTALLPDAATHLEVTPHQRNPVTIALV